MRFQNSAFDFFQNLGEYYRRQGYEGLQWKRLDRYTILRSFLRSRETGMAEQENSRCLDWETLDRLLLHDLYLRENLKKRPAWARQYEEQKKEIAEFFKRSGYQGKLVHLEPWKEKGRQGFVLYDYEEKDVFDHSARTEFIPDEKFYGSLSLGGEKR